jgi:hypothetical protein
MPIYLYQHPIEEDMIEVVQGMDDEHVYVDEYGVKWNRVFTSPNASIDNKIDPFNKNKFVEKTGNMKGSVGDIWDKSAELSAQRAKVYGGEDPVQKKHFDDYAKKRGGKRHPKEAAQKTIKI